MTRAALYARVSTPDQRLDAQLGPLQEYVSRRGWSAQIFKDTASGADRQRPGLDALLAAARKRRIDAVVVTKLDRLGRSVAHLFQLLDELRAIGVDFIAVDQSIDTTTPQGRMMLTFLAGIAEFERELIRERTRAGLAAAKARGTRLGAPPKVDVSDDALREMARRGLGVRAMARSCGLAASTVSRRLKAVGAERASRARILGPAGEGEGRP